MASHGLNLADELNALMRGCGFQSCAAEHEVTTFHQLASDLIPGPIAPAEVMAAVQSKTKASLYLRRGDARSDGFLALFAFSAQGEAALSRGAFSGLSVKPEWVEAPSPRSRTGYVWGFGGATRPARFSVLRALQLMRRTLFPNLGLFMRAASDEGRALMSPFGASPTRADATLFYAPPLNKERQQ